MVFNFKLLIVIFLLTGFPPQEYLQFSTPYGRENLGRSSEGRCVTTIFCFLIL